MAPRAERGKGARGEKGKGKGKGASLGKGAGDGIGPPRPIAEQIGSHIDYLRDRSRSSTADQMNKQDPREERDKFQAEWRKSQRGAQVPYRFRIKEPQGKGEPQKEVPYADYAGLRFPTLETAENYDYNKYRGLERLVDHAFPIKVPGHRRLDPYLREYIHFLHSLDPVRFTVARIAERYRLREKTVRKVCQEWGVNRYLTRTGLSSVKERQQTREGKVLAAKEAQYAKWVGWDQLGDEDDVESDDEKLGEHKGWRSTNDWVRRQNVEVESMSAFPMMAKRDPMPKRVDVDLVVESRQHVKIINWLDPSDKVAF